MPIEYWFPTPIFVRDYTGSELESIQSEITSALPDIKLESTPVITGGAMLSTFKWGNGNAHDIVKYNLTHLKQAVQNAVDDYTMAINYQGPPFQFGGSWFNLSTRGGTHFDHVHPYTRISGCYYYQTQGNEGHIKFQNPNPIIHMGGFPADQLVQDSVKIAPLAGRLVLFPCWLTHRVEINKTDNERISIAFNIN
jgi:uncharacterized protein (TIGR02466 family)